jgi:hypothetical protein
MVLVLVFVALMLCFYSVAYRHVAAALRVETARTLRQQRDAGSMQAVAQGVTLLETGVPPTDPYVCAVLIGPPGEELSYTATFTLEGENAWSVHAAPTEWPDEPEPMPASFAELVP